jgi:hypothetical protein
VKEGGMKVNSVLKTLGSLKMSLFLQPDELFARETRSVDGKDPVVLVIDRELLN